MEQTMDKPQNANEMMKAFNAQQEFEALLMSTYMPKEQISDQWKCYANLALEFASLRLLGINIKQFTHLKNLTKQYCTREEDPEISLFDFALLSNNLESRSAHDLHVDLDMFIEVMTEAHALVDTWSALQEPLKEIINARVIEEKEKDYRARNKGKNKHFIPPAKKPIAQA